MLRCEWVAIFFAIGTFCITTLLNTMSNLEVLGSSRTSAALLSSVNRNVGDKAEEDAASTLKTAASFHDRLYKLARMRLPKGHIHDCSAHSVKRLCSNTF